MAAGQDSLGRRFGRQVKRWGYALLQLRDTPEAIALGAAVGIFIGITPTVGLQSTLTLLVTVNWRINRTAALIAIWISNPFTTIPVYAVDYIVGKRILGSEQPVRVLVERLKETGHFAEKLTVMWEFGWPLLLGGVVLGLVFAVPTYIIVLRLIRNERLVMGRDLTAGLDHRLIARWRWRPLVLASGSARREKLLKDLGLSFLVTVPDVDETVPRDVDPPAAAEKVAERKARAALTKSPKGIILAADTIVEVDGDILGKPADRDDARRMLERLSGNSQRIITGVALLDARTGTSFVRHAVTALRMKKLTEGEIAAYVESGEGMGKAGGYAIQETGDRFVEAIDGSISNVIGLPLETVQELLLAWEADHRARKHVHASEGAAS